MDLKDSRQNETIDVHYLDPGGTNFSFVTRMSIPHVTRMSIPHVTRMSIPYSGATLRPVDPPELAFSANGSKFAMGMGCGGVSVWNIQSKAPLQTFTETPLHEDVFRHPRFLQFSSGNLGKEILVFVEVRLMFTFGYPYRSNRWPESLA